MPNIPGLAKLHLEPSFLQACYVSLLGRAAMGEEMGVSFRMWSPPSEETKECGIPREKRFVSPKCSPGEPCSPVSRGGPLAAGKHHGLAPELLLHRPLPKPPCTCFVLLARMPVWVRAQECCLLPATPGPVSSHVLDVPLPERWTFSRGCSGNSCQRPSALSQAEFPRG